MDAAVDTRAYPAVPTSIDDTGLQPFFLEDLVLKTIATDANCTSKSVADKIKLPLTVTENLLQSLYRERLIEIKERTGAKVHRYSILDRGLERTRHLFSVSGYTGPAPVTLDSYCTVTRWLHTSMRKANPEAVARAFSHLVLSRAELETLGLVIDSRRSLFLTGPPGSGKTTAAKALHSALEGEIWIPYSIEIDGQVIRVFDPTIHRPVSTPDLRYDRRWVKIERPLVIVGGELTLESMDLIFAANLNYYEAPFQMKANGGVLIIDDFGRQRVQPHDLLNRWTMPLENHLDYLALHTGKKIEVPFEVILIFATNLDTKDLVDEAFLRRMGYRLAFRGPSEEIYARILARYLGSRSIPFDPELLPVIFERYRQENRTMKGCDPRDLIERCLDICRYENLEKRITAEVLERAWDAYFGRS
jgi:DNA polymerase III delta prime subunit